MGRGWGRVGDGLGRGLGRGWGRVGAGLDFSTSKTPFEKTPLTFPRIKKIVVSETKIVTAYLTYSANVDNGLDVSNRVLVETRFEASKTQF